MPVTILLYIYIAIHGHDPKELQLPITDIESCKQSESNIYEAAPEILQKFGGGSIQASCVIFMEPSDPA